MFLWIYIILGYFSVRIYFGLEDGVFCCVLLNESGVIRGGEFFKMMFGLLN